MRGRPRGLEHVAGAIDGLTETRSLEHQMTQLEVLRAQPRALQKLSICCRSRSRAKNHATAKRSRLGLTGWSAAGPSHD
jgi:hypothetical protein